MPPNQEHGPWTLPAKDGGGERKKLCVAVGWDKGMLCLLKNQKAQRRKQAFSFDLFASFPVCFASGSGCAARHRGTYVVLPEGKGKARLKGVEMGQHVLRRMRGGEGHFGNFGVVFFREPQGTQGVHAGVPCTKQFLAAAVAHKQAFFRQ